MGILPYIHHSNTREIIARIDNAWSSVPKERLIIPILGQIGTGKRALLEHYAGEHRKQMSGTAFQHTPIALADIREAEKEKTKRGAYVTTATFNAFSEIVFALGETAEQLGKKPDYNRWFMPGGSQSTDYSFNALYNFVRTEFKALGVHGLILLHANHLDRKAFEMLRR